MKSKRGSVPAAAPDGKPALYGRLAQMSLGRRLVIALSVICFAAAVALPLAFFRQGLLFLGLLLFLGGTSLTLLLAWRKPGLPGLPVLMLVTVFAFPLAAIWPINDSMYWPARLLIVEPGGRWALLAMNAVWWLFAAWGGYRMAHARMAAQGTSLSPWLRLRFNRWLDARPGSAAGRVMHYLASSAIAAVFLFFFWIWFLGRVDDNLRNLVYLLSTEPEIVQARVAHAGQDQVRLGRAKRLVRYWDLELPGSSDVFRMRISDMGKREAGLTTWVTDQERRRNCWGYASAAAGDLVRLAGRRSWIGFAPDQVAAITSADGRRGCNADPRSS